MRSPPPPRVQGFLARALFAWLAISSAGCGAGSADADSLFAPGSHEVGFRQERLAYARAGTGEERRITISIWYPAAPSR